MIIIHCILFRRVITNVRVQNFELEIKNFMCTSKTYEIDEWERFVLYGIYNG